MKVIVAILFILLLSDCRKSDVSTQSYWTVNSTKYYANRALLNPENAIMYITPHIRDQKVSELS
jgi:hypothetical protein